MKKMSTTALAALLGSAFLGGNAFGQDAPQTEGGDDGAVVSEEAVVSGEVVVRGFRIPDEKRVTSEVTSLLDADDLARTGDSDIGSALQRVTGLSLSQGRFVIVRGLNERYSSVTLDGSPLPSPEPLRRVVPLDIVPTNFLSGTLVQKTFSPELSGEFGGGLVELRSKSIPDEPYLQLGFSVGGDTETWGQDGLTYRGGNNDDLGIDDGTRDIPAALSDAYFGTMYGADAADAVRNLSLEYERTTVIQTGDLAPDSSFDVSFGASRDLSDGVRIGANVALSFSNDWQTAEGRRETGFDAAAGANSRPYEIEAGFDGTGELALDFLRTEQTVEANALATIGLELGEDHKFAWTNLLLRSTVKEARNSIGVRSEEPGQELYFENLEFIERQVWQTQVRGDHLFTSLGNLEMGWRAAYGQALRDSPYQRGFFRYRTSVEDDYFIFGSPVRPNPISLRFSEIEDRNLDAGVDFTYPLILSGHEYEIKFGAAHTAKERDSLNRNFLYQEGSTYRVPDEVNTARNDVVLSPEVVGNGLVELTFSPDLDALDNAFSELTVNAVYAGLETAIGDYIRVSAGGRFEDGEQTTAAFRTNFPTESGTTVTLAEQYLLPAATLTWNPIGDLQVRFGYSQTITRPQFRELTPAAFTDDQTDLRILGNPFLVDSEIKNFDARAEYYFSRGQFATIGFFYKDILNPIETTSRVQNEEILLTYVNAPSAELYGFESEFERVFGLGEFLGESFDSTDLVFKANYTWSQSSVNLPSSATVIAAGSPGQTGPVSAVPQSADNFGEDGRQLQGQSDHLINFQLGVEDETRLFRATLLLNYASERIRQTERRTTSTSVVPAVVEQPPLTIDLVASKGFNSFGGGWEVGMELRNLLGEDYEATQSFDDGEVEFDSYELGTSVSFSLKKSF